MSERNLVFFSYRHDPDGEKWLSALHGMLEPYVRGQDLICWSDRDIRTGDQWHTRIQEAIGRTRVAVLLVNHRFFGSDYIRCLELPRLVADAHAGKLTLVCVQIGHDDPQLRAGHGLSNFQFSHDPATPLSALRGARREKTLVGIALKVREAYGYHAGSVPVAPVTSLVPQGKKISIKPVPSGNVPPRRPGPLLDIPDLDLFKYVPRTSELEVIRRDLLHGTELTLGITSQALGLGLHGMGGMGKSVMAQALCHDEETRCAFPDGVAWIAFGQQPDVLALQNRLLRLLDPQSLPAESQSDARIRLQALLKEQCALIVIDDLWDARHFRAFGGVQGRSRLLVTSRDASVLMQIGAQPHALQRLSGPLARELLTLWSDCDLEDLPPEADDVIDHTNGVPLALALAGAQVADGVSWATLLDQLRQGRIDFLDHAYGSVYDSLGRSINMLPQTQCERYLELAVFPEDVSVPASVIARLWQYSGLGAAETEKLLAQLDRKALLTLSGSGSDRSVTLHDLQLDFLRLRNDNLEALHARLLDACRSSLSLPDGVVGWACLPPQELYLWRQLTYHLAAANLDQELEAMLLDRDWIKARLAVETRTVGGHALVDVIALRSDYVLAPMGSAARLVDRMLRASAHVLRTHPEALDQQLFGRLGSSENVALKILADAGLAGIKREEVFLPMLSALLPPGAVDAVMAGHEDWVSGALLLPDGRRALSWSGDRTLRLWDLAQGGEAKVLAGHEGPVDGALVLPDGRRALSWSEDRTLRLWDLEQDGEAKVLAGHGDWVSGALVLPDGRRALSWSWDSTLRLWGLEHGGEAKILAGHEGSVHGALLLPDERRALSWSGDGTLRLWDLEQGGEVKVLAGHEDRVHGALVLPDGRRALSWSEDRTLRLWDLKQGGEAKVLAGHKGPVHGALVLPDGRRALSWSEDRTLRLWDLEQGAETEVLAGHEGWVHGALVLPDGRRALSWSGDRTLRLWDLEQGGEAKVLAGHEGWVNGALLLPQGRRALSWSEDRTLRLWDLEQGGEAKVLAGHEGSVHGALVLSQGRRALSCSKDRTLRLWDLEQGGEAKVLAGHEGEVNGALLLPDGRRALSWSWDRTLRLWDLKQGGEAKVLAGHEDSIHGALLLPDGRRALSWSEDRTLRLWDLEQGGEAKVLAGHEGEVNGALVLPDGRRALSWSGDRTLRLWDLEQGGEAKVLAGHEGWVKGALLLLQGRRALSWSEDRTLRLWDLEQGCEAKVLAGHEDWVNGALLLPDGRRALSWSEDRTLRLWDLEQGGEAKVLAGHGGSVHGALLLPDGRRALSWSEDRTLRLWDLKQGGEAKVLAGHESPVIGALVLPDGQRTLSWSRDRTLRLWDLEQGGKAKVLAGHEGPVTGALVLPDGQRALSWSEDLTLQLWDLNSCWLVAAYFAEATIRIVLNSASLRKILIIDALGKIQILQINDAQALD